MPATSSDSRATSCSGIAVSSTARSRNGETIPSRDERQISDEDDGEPEPVGTKEAGDAAQVRAPNRRIRGPVGHLWRLKSLSATTSCVHPGHPRIEAWNPYATDWRGNIPARMPVSNFVRRRA